MSSLYLERKNFKGELKALNEIENMYLEGNYDLCFKRADELASSTKSKSIYAACCGLGAFSAIHLGSCKKWQEYINKVENLKTDESFNSKSKELLLYTTKISVDYKLDCPKWLFEGRFEGLPIEAYAYARTAFIFSRNIDVNMLPSTSLLEPLCCQTDVEGVEPAAVYTHIFLAACYHNQGNNEKTRYHLNKAIDIAVKYRWIGPIIEMRNRIGPLFDEILMEREPKLAKIVINRGKTYLNGWSKVYNGFNGICHPISKLSMRECEIARLAAIGHRNKEIANITGLSVETVKYDMSSIFQKLGIANRAELRNAMYIQKS